ncbi:MAG: histidine kinase [Betaproteobacteria bacterium HGW-Betaproteobacteria-12]|jgi:HD-like signal output (HDOD) protein|nr:MAG: histidine kinase [Betaproteobacteria bacterium HGW-Betaproteobacteria-12]
MNSREAIRRLAAAAEGGELVFSTHAHVALQVRMALDDPEIHMDKAAKLVQAEPMLAAKVVGLANSVAYNRTGKPVSDVRTAVLRLGLPLIRGLSTALIMRQFATAQSPEQASLSARLWEHSTHVAALSHVLARRVSRQNPEMALFAGIVHEVGSFYLISRAGDCPDLLGEGVEEAWRSGGEAQVGQAVLRGLSVPDEIAAAVRAQWEGNFTLPPKNLADTLYLANCLTPIANPLQQPSADMERNAMLALSTQVMADRTLGEILEESGEELNTLAASLSF